MKQAQTSDKLFKAHELILAQRYETEKQTNNMIVVAEDQMTSSNELYGITVALLKVSGAMYLKELRR